MALSRTDTKYGSHSHSWNDEDHAFGYQLYQWGVEKLFQNSYEVITRDLKLYIEDWEKLIQITRYNYQISCFLQNMAARICMIKI